MRGPRQYLLPALALLLACCAGYGWHSRTLGDGAIPIEVFDRVVVPAPLQIALAGGDRFLAANMEAIRALAAPSDSPDAVADNLSFAIRARIAVANLNPCHEDNFYLANALLSWGGASAYGNEVLHFAARCRFWDEFPPFFYGFNLYYFEHDVRGATEAINEAANRSRDNAQALRKFAIMLMAESLHDDSSALAYLRHERDQARDSKLRDALDKRVLRLERLIMLKDAQATYEQRLKRSLTDPNELIRLGIIDRFPADPLKLGYEFTDGRFQMRQVKIPGLEHK